MDIFNIKLSICIVTRNRSRSLERTLLSLSAQSMIPFEVIISDDSNNECEIQKNKILSQEFKCKYLSGPRKGLYANRNFIAKNAIGTHIRTMDDDHEFPENHLQECLKSISLEPETIWVIGEYYPSDKDHTLPAPVPGQLHPRGFSYAPSNMKNYYGISCGATIYPRSIIDRNILNADLYHFGILYLEYGARLLYNKYRIKSLDTTYIIHHYDENNRSISSLNTIAKARLFSMFMLSFYHRRSITNITQTLFQIFYEVLLKKYSLAMVIEVYKDCKKYNFDY